MRSLLISEQVELADGSVSEKQPIYRRERRMKWDVEQLRT